jgi:hypothetical protein
MYVSLCLLPCSSVLSQFSEIRYTRLKEMLAQNNWHLQEANLSAAMPPNYYVFHYYVTNTVERDLSWKLVDCHHGQETVPFLCNPTVLYHRHKKASLLLTLKHTKPVYPLMSYYFQIHLILSSHECLSLQSYLISSGFLDEIRSLYSETKRLTNFQIYFGTKLYMFRAVSLPIIRNFPLCIRHWHMLYRSDGSSRVGSGWNCVPSWSYTRVLVSL